MLKRTFLILAVLFGFKTSYSQTIELPKFVLSSVPFDLSITEIPDSIKSVEIVFKSEDQSYIHNLEVYDGEVNANISIEESDTYKVRCNDISVKSKDLKVIPGWFSIVPPLLAILLALILRQVIVSLSIGIFSGVLIYYNFNPLVAFLRFADTLMMDVLIDRDHMFIIVFTLLIGGVVGIISKNGGTAGLAKEITKLANNARNGMIASWLMGVVIFFDDYANSLIIGNMMRPITDRLKISREKLAYIVDSTAAPVASIFIISTWIGYEVGLIDEGLKIIGSDQNAYDMFISSIPYSFYPIAAIFFVFLTSYMQRDFGPMLYAERRARKFGKVANDSIETEPINDKSDELFENENAKWYNGAVPILIILIGTIIGLVYTGIQSIDSQNITDYSIQNIINYSDAYSSLLWSSFTAAVVAIIMSVYQKIIPLHESIAAWEKGIKSMFAAVLILVFAWAISKITSDLKTADYVISLLSDSIDPKLLPSIIFIICAVIGFSTGTSWGTMAIVMPIVIPLTYKVGTDFGLLPDDLQIIMYGVISSVLAGSVFGDHCSPIADTTILSSLASKCNHIDHVRTQLPYALLVGVLSVGLGYLPSAYYGLSPFYSIAAIFVTLIGFLFMFGKKAE
ncbi:MAG: Na+/H+ antiporter NhaC family protein [Bacteroidota bacterium]